MLLTLMAKARDWRRELASLDHLGFPVSLARNRHRESDAKAGVEGEEIQWEELGFGSGSVDPWDLNPVEI